MEGPPYCTDEHRRLVEGLASKCERLLVFIRPTVRQQQRRLADRIGLVDGYIRPQSQKDTTSVSEWARLLQHK